MEVGETAGESPPSASEPTAQNPPAPATTNRSSPQPARPTTADVEHKPTNGEPRSLGVTKGADISGDSGIGAGDGEGSGGGGGGFASLARKLTSKGKGVAKPPGDAAVGVASEKQQNGCPDDLDLPLGSEAYSISSLQVNGIDSTSRISVGPDAVSSQKAAAQSGMMGWQSFNSDVSTSAASTASLDMLLNDRLVDPEEVLFNLGFGGPQPVAYVPSLARIPQRFLQAAASRAAAGDDGTGDALPGLGGFSSPEDGPGSAGGGGGGGGSGGLAAAVQAMQQQGAAGGQMGRKRTGGFCVSDVLFFPCHGYVDLARLVQVYGIPLVFFNREGSKCYRRVRLRSIRAGMAGGDAGAGDGGGSENAATVERRKSNRKSRRTIRRRKTGGKSMHQSRSWIESVEEEEIEKGSETKEQKDKVGKEEVGKSVRIKTDSGVEESPQPDNTSPNATEKSIVKNNQHQSSEPLTSATERIPISGDPSNELVSINKNQEPNAVAITEITVPSSEPTSVKKSLSPAESLFMDKSGKPRRKKFFDLSYVKLAAKKLGDAMSGKLSKSRMYDLNAASAADETGQFVSDIIRQQPDNDDDRSEIRLEKMISQSSEVCNQSLKVPDEPVDDGSQRLESSDPGNLGRLASGQREMARGQKGLRTPELKRHGHTSSHPNLVSRLCMAPLLGGYVSKWSGASSAGKVCAETEDKMCNSDSAINRRDDDTQSLSGSHTEMSPRCHSLEPEDRPVVEEMVSPKVSSVACAVQHGSDSHVESYDTDIVCNITMTSCESSVSSLPPHRDSSVYSSNVNTIDAGESLKSSPCTKHDTNGTNLAVEPSHTNIPVSNVTDREIISPNTVGRQFEVKIDNTPTSIENKSLATEIVYEASTSIVKLDSFPQTSLESTPEVSSINPVVSTIDSVPVSSTLESQGNIVSCHAPINLSFDGEASGGDLTLENEGNNRIIVESKDDSEGIYQEKTARDSMEFQNVACLSESEGLENMVSKKTADDRNEDAGDEKVSIDNGDAIHSDRNTKDNDNKACATSDANDENDTTDQNEDTDVAPVGSLGPDALLESGHQKLSSSSALSLLAPSAVGMGFLLSLGLPRKEEEEENSSEVSSEYGHSREDRLHDFEKTGNVKEAQHLPEDQSSIEEEEDHDEYDDDDESEYDDEIECEYDDNYVSEGDEEELDMFEVGNVKDNEFEESVEVSYEGFKCGPEIRKGRAENISSFVLSQAQREQEMLEPVQRQVLNVSCKRKLELVSAPPPINQLNSPDLPTSKNSSFPLPYISPLNAPFNYKRNMSSPKPVTFHLSLENIHLSTNHVRLGELRQKNSLQQRRSTPADKQGVSPVTPEITLTDSEGIPIPKSYSSQTFYSFSSDRAKSMSTSRSFDRFPDLRAFGSSTDATYMGSSPRISSASSSSLASDSSNYQRTGRTSPRLLGSTSPTTALFLKLRNTAPPSASYAGSFVPRSPSSDFGLPKGQKSRNSLTVDTMNSLRAFVQENARSLNPGNETAAQNVGSVAITDVSVDTKKLGQATAVEINIQVDAKNTTPSDVISSEIIDRVDTEDALNVRTDSLNSTPPIVNVPIAEVTGFKNMAYPPVEEESESSNTHNIEEVCLLDQRASAKDTDQPASMKSRSQSVESNPVTPEASKAILPLSLAQRKRQERKTIDFDPRIPSRKLCAYSSLTQSPLPEDTSAEFNEPTSYEPRHTPRQLPPDVTDRRQSLLMRRRTSTGCITARQSSIPALASSSSAEWAWLLSSRRTSDDLDRLSTADQADPDMSNVSTSSDEDSESDTEDRRPSDKWDEIFSRPSGSVIFGL